MTAIPSTTPSAREAWNSIAPRFDQFVTPQNISHGQEIIRRAGAGPGTRFLDVAAGSGALSIPAARMGADVVAVDISPAMIDHLARRAKAEGLQNLQAEVMDGCDLQFADDTFDVAASQHGVSLFPDVARGIAELRRVTKPGGQVLLAAFGLLQKAEHFGFFLGAIRAVAPDLPMPPMDPPPLPFQLADPEVFGSKLRDAGLVDVSVETVTWDLEVEHAAELWNFISSSHPLGAGLSARLSGEQRDEARKVLAGMLRERSAGGTISQLHTEINIGVGRK